MLGAGGTARAVVFGLIERGAAVPVLNRSAARAEALARELGAQRRRPARVARGHSARRARERHVGRDGAATIRRSAAASIRPDAVVLDAVYAPEQTRLLRDARARGARVVSGRWMLVHQAVAQLEAWAGPIDRALATRVMAEAFGPQPA